MEKVKYVLGPLTGILGIYFTFGSLYFYKTTWYIIGLWSTPVFILGILYGICIPSSSPIWLVSVLICVATFIGLFVGYFSMKFTIVAKNTCGLLLWIRDRVSYLHIWSFQDRRFYYCDDYLLGYLRCSSLDRISDRSILLPNVIHN